MASGCSKPKIKNGVAMLTNDELIAAVEQNSEVSKYFREMFAKEEDLKSLETENAKLKEDLKKAKEDLDAAEKASEEIKQKLDDAQEQLSSYRLAEARAKRESLISETLKEVKIKPEYVFEDMHERWLEIKEDEEVIKRIKSFANHVKEKLAKNFEGLAPVINPSEEETKEDQSSSPRLFNLSTEELRKVVG